MRKPPIDNSHLDEVVIYNPATGQTMTATKKTFGSIYMDKGFEIVDRDNAADAGPGRKNAKSANLKKSEPASIMPGGTAGDVAARLGLDSDPAASGTALPQAATPNAASGNGTNAIETDTDNAGAEGRDSNRRDRGRVG